MFRFFLLICLSVLLYGSSASPYKTWGKAGDRALQDTRSDEFDEKMTLGLKEVEPLEDLDLTDADIEPGMLIWKAVKHLRQQTYYKPEEDKDEVYHPPEVKLIVGNRQPYRAIQPQPYRQVLRYQEPEQDMDDLYHSDPERFEGELLQNVVQTGAKDMDEVAKPPGRLMYLSPEEDKDDLYHQDVPSESVLEAPVMQAFESKPKMVYTEPEEDLDKLYHN